VFRQGVSEDLDNMLFTYRTIQDPASQRLTWYKPPLTVLVIKKVRDISVLQPFVQLVNWLIEVSISDDDVECCVWR
jgi:hypothetical protein